MRPGRQACGAVPDGGPVSGGAPHVVGLDHFAADGGAVDGEVDAGGAVRVGRRCRLGPVDVDLAGDRLAAEHDGTGPVGPQGQVEALGARGVRPGGGRHEPCGDQGEYDGGRDAARAGGTKDGRHGGSSSVGAIGWQPSGDPFGHSA